MTMPPWFDESLQAIRAMRTVRWPFSQESLPVPVSEAFADVPLEAFLGDVARDLRRAGAGGDGPDSFPGYGAVRGELFEALSIPLGC